MFDPRTAHNAMGVLSGKWTLHIIAGLADGPQSYNTVARTTGIETKALSRSLHCMEDAGLIERRVRRARPLRVEYRLAPAAQPLLELLEQLFRWWCEELGGVNA